jgi:hypothetical protein
MREIDRRVRELRALRGALAGLLEGAIPGHRCPDPVSRRYPGQPRHQR